MCDNEMRYLDLFMISQQYDRLTKQNEMFKYLPEIDLLRKGEKGIIILLVGKALHVLFGTVTESNLKLKKE